MTAAAPIAAAADLVACRSCALLVPAPSAETAARHRCPRCDATLHRRKPDSLNRTWAFLVAAAVLYIPANAFPIMTVVTFGRGSPDTILSGVQHLAAAGEYAIAALVFFASIFVPIVKIAVLGFLLLSVQRRSRWRPRDRAVLYRFVESIGRWSMIDIFMISILVALVQLGAVATVEAGIGATSFAAVVVLTMLASASFDPRLIWDRMDSSDKGTGR